MPKRTKTEEEIVRTSDGVPVLCAHDALADVTQVNPNPRNPNTHPPAQIELLARVIAASGWRAPITVSTRSGMVVRGHGRLLAAQHAGWAQVPVDMQDYPDEATELADLLADNRLAELAEMDRGMLRDVLLDLDTGDVDLSMTGYDEEALEELMTAAPPSEMGDEGSGSNEDGHGDKTPRSVTCPVCGEQFTV